MNKVSTLGLIGIVLLSWTVRCAAGTAQDRGWLNLAWDAHDAGLFQEALDYLDRIPRGSELEADALWLRAECLYDLGRYPEAAQVLESEPASALGDRDGFLLDVYWDWARAEIREGRGKGAREVAGRALEHLPRNPYVWALDAITAFRAGLVEALRSRGAGPLAAGERLALLGEGRSPRGEGWVRAHPWDPEAPWVPEVTWVDLGGRELQQVLRDHVAWVQVDPSRLVRSLEAAASRLGLAFQRDGEGVVLSGQGESVWIDPAEWRFRAAVEALGLEGAARLAVARAAEDLDRRARLVAWVWEHAGPLQIARHGPVLRLRHPRTGRVFLLDPGAWAERFSPDDGSWTAFWDALRVELGRRARPFRCFCGRPVVLREMLVTDPGEALVWEKEGTLQVVVAALCPEHVRYVTADVVREWGVGLRDVAERVRKDATEREWDVTFARGDVEGVSVLALNGEGLASLARWPELLLGALEAIDGPELRGRAVQVVAPSPWDLIVLPAGTGRRAETEAVRWGLETLVRLRGPVERIHFRSRVRLPTRAEGRFRVRPAE